MFICWFEVVKKSHMREYLKKQSTDTVLTKESFRVFYCCGDNACDRQSVVRHVLEDFCILQVHLDLFEKVIRV